MGLGVMSAILLSVVLAPTLVPGDALPKLEGHFLTGKEAELPKAAAGRVSLLAIGFTYESRHAVEAWVKAFRADFGTHPDVGFYEIPMIGGMARLGKWFIDSGMRRGTPPSDQEHVITVYGGTDAWKERLGFKQSDAAYLVLLDKNGIVRWQHSGTFDAAAYAELSGRMRALLNR